ncbi:hypothetical protein ACI75Y_03055 [Capnocytophaga stomatis]|uniref:hypothetical protein n=1 Tax=Capnocytophaga stomatis TaxID=1848904 RepID=UPI0038588D7A
MEETKKEVKNKINWSLWLSVVAIILSIFSFFISEGTLQFDSINFIIGVLAILVTVLIGWQIYNVVGVKRELEKFEEKINIEIKENEHKIENSKKEIKTQIDEMRGKINYNFNSLAFELYSNLSILHSPDKGDIFYSLYYSLMCLSYIKKQGDNFEKKREKAHLERIDAVYKKLLTQGINLGESKSLLCEIIITNELQKQYNEVDSIMKEILSK